MNESEIAEIVEKLVELSKSNKAHYKDALAKLPPLISPLDELLSVFNMGEERDLVKYAIYLRDDDADTYYSYLEAVRAKLPDEYDRIIQALTGSAKDALMRLFQMSNVTRVVFVDDEFASVGIDDFIGICENTDPERLRTIPALAEIPFEGGAEVFRPILEPILHADPSIVKKWRAELSTSDGNDSPDIDEPLIFTTLSTLFEGDQIGYEQLTPAEWEQKKDTLLQVENGTATLFLFDQDLRHAGGGAEDGIRFVRETLASTSNTGVLCALLTHTLQTGNEHSEWERYRKEGMDGSRFILISKKRQHPDPIGFVRKASLAALNAPYNELLEKVAATVREAQSIAETKVKEIDIYDFEHMVVKSSQVEGVWEPDTLFRIFGIYHRLRARELARQPESGIEPVASRLRQLAGLEVGPRYKASGRAVELRHHELYEGPELISRYHLPIEVGDIFDSNNKKYILVAPPCDLMLRQDRGGERHRDVTEATLLEIVNPGSYGPTSEDSPFVNGKPKQPGNFFELPCFDKTNGKSWYASFRKRYSVKLFMLDMCVYSSEGKSEMTLSDVCPEGIHPLWTLHFANLHMYIKSIYDEYAVAVQSLRDEVAMLKIPFATNSDRLFKRHVIVPNKTGAAKVGYACQRILRLSPPRSTALISQFATYVARDAFDHDFSGLAS